MVCLLAAPWVQLTVSAGNGWLHNALRYHWLMPISCHFRDCKAQVVTSLTHVSGANKCPDLYLYLLGCMLQLCCDSDALDQTSCRKTCRRSCWSTTPRTRAASWRCRTSRPVSAVTSPTHAVISSRTARDFGPTECSTPVDQPSTAVSAPSPIFKLAILFFPLLV